VFRMVQKRIYTAKWIRYHNPAGSARRLNIPVQPERIKVALSLTIPERDLEFA